MALETWSSSKAQSAMEYLMTYGWAILIIAIVMVALLFLGLFGPSLGTVCIVQSGFQCSSPVLNHATGALSVMLGQSTGTDWTTANIIFIPQAAQGTAISSAIFTAGNYISLASLPSGSSVALTGATALPITATLGQTSVNPGTVESGTIWAQYTESQYPGFLYVKMATITMRAA